MLVNGLSIYIDNTFTVGVPQNGLFKYKKLNKTYFEFVFCISSCFNTCIHNSCNFTPVQSSINLPLYKAVLIYPCTKQY